AGLHDGAEVVVAVPGPAATCVYLHAHGREFAGDVAADRSGADDKSAFAGDPFGLPVLPTTLALVLPGAGEVLGKGQDQTEHVLGDGLLEDSTRVGDHHVAVHQFGEHEVVHARGGGVHPGQGVGLGPGRDQGLGEQVPHQECVGTGQLGGQIIG